MKGGKEKMNYLKKLMKDKRGLTLSDAFPAVLTIGLVSVVVLVLITLFTQLRSGYTVGSSEYNLSDTLIRVFTSSSTYIGLIVTIVFLAIVIGILINSFMGRREGV